MCVGEEVGRDVQGEMKLTVTYIVYCKTSAFPDALPYRYVYRNQCFRGGFSVQLNPTDKNITVSILRVVQEEPCFGHAMAHAVSHQPTTVKAQVQSQTRLCGICGGQRALGLAFLPVVLFCHFIVYQCFIIIDLSLMLCDISS